MNLASTLSCGSAHVQLVLVHSRTPLPLGTCTNTLDLQANTKEIRNLPVPSFKASQRTVREGQHCALEDTSFAPATSSEVAHVQGFPTIRETFCI